MDCVEVKDNLPFFGDGSLDPATEQEMDRHLAHCPGCADAYEAQKRVLNLVAAAYGASETAPSIDLTAAIRKGIAARKREHGLFKYLTPVAAAAVIIISVVLHGYNMNQPGALYDVADIDDATYAYIGEYFVSSYDLLSHVDVLPMDDSYDIDAEALIESGYMDISPNDLFESLDEETLDVLLQQALLY